jgi:hypothetical protein
MTCGDSGQPNAVGDTTRKLAQSMQNCWQAEPAVHKTMVSNSRRCSESSARLQSTARGACSTLSIILCVSMIPSVFSSCSLSVDVVPSEIRHWDSPATFLPDTPKLKKSISFSSKMTNHANFKMKRNCQADLQDDENEPLLYTPVHSSSQSERAGTRPRGHVAGGSSPAADWRPRSGDMAAAAPYVYTLLQTQLFPEMRF